MLKVPIIVMGGSAYADIDVLACAAAYKQYLELLGCKAHALITGPWNQTIPLSVKNWQIDVEKKFIYSHTPCQFVLVDFSDPKYIDSCVDLDSVIEVFDHHYGYEKYWNEKIGNKAQIESIGACATLIWEKFKLAKIEDQISIVNANLLYTAIFANTLNFQSKVTHERDITAANELLFYTQLPSNWKEIYYAEIEEEFLKSSIENIVKDTKYVTIFENPFNFGQIELSNAQDFLQKSIDDLESLGRSKNCKNNTKHWLVNIVSIQEKCSYLYCNSIELSNVLKKITSAQLTLEITNDNSHLLVTKRLWLRKEILKEMIIFQNNHLSLNC